MKTDLDAFTAGYVAAIYFTDTGDRDEPSGTLPLSSETRAAIIKDCANFQEEASDFLLLAYLADYYERGKPFEYTPSMAGVDFWLTRNNHGAGYWDRGLGDIGDDLTALAKTFPNRSAYLADSGNEIEVSA